MHLVGGAVDRVVPQGAASAHLQSGVSFRNKQETVFAAMVTGWEMQQRGGRGLLASTATMNLRVVRQLREFLDLWPWEWEAKHFDEWMFYLTEEKRLVLSTRRKYQSAVREFSRYLTSPHYGWIEQCDSMFGKHPIQISHEGNSVVHTAADGSPRRRPLTRDELTSLFGYLDDEVDRKLESGRKGALTTWRNSVALKVLYGWGLRQNEAAHLELTDFYSNPAASEFGKFGVIQVRMGKGSRGSGPRSRSVLTVPLMSWAVVAVREFISEVRPLMRSENDKLLFVSERGTRVRTREIAEAFGEARKALGLDPAVTPHSLRHSYVTHMIEAGYDQLFVQRQVGHVYSATTAIYSGVSSDFANKMMRNAVAGLLPAKTDERGTN